MHQTQLLEYILNSNVINFLIVVGVLVTILKKVNITKIIEDKQKKIIEDVVASENKLNESLEILEESKKKVSNIDSEKLRILTNSDEVGKIIAVKIKEETVRKEENIKVRTEKIVENDKYRTKKEVTKKITDAAFEVAKQHILHSLDDKKHFQLIDEFIENLDNTKV